MFEYVSETQDLVLSVVALMRRGRIAVEIVDGSERDRGQVRRSSRMWTGGSPAVCHLDEPPYQCRTGVMRAQSTTQKQVSQLLISLVYLFRFYIGTSSKLFLKPLLILHGATAQTSKICSHTVVPLNTYILNLINNKIGKIQLYQSNFLY